MRLEEKKNALIGLGEKLGELGQLARLEHSEDERFESLIRAKVENPWFTLENIKRALDQWSAALSEESVEAWIERYQIEYSNPKKIGLVLAGNIPLVGFHDVLSVWVAGHEAHVKMSSKDKILLPLVLSELEKIHKGSSSSIVFREESIADVDAVIATGSNNSSRYFEHYFGRMPHIIRKNRNSVAVVQDSDSEEDLKALGDDIFCYFGMGCRNVSKVYLPENMKIDRLFGGLMEQSNVNMHHKYMNNYEYNKTVWLMSNYELLENGFVVLKEDEGLASPLGTLFYERYSDLNALEKSLQNKKDEIQCVVGNLNLEGAVSYGQSQNPRLWDYADGIDTMEFLLGLHE